jgi:hypothetical protein
MVFLAPDKYHKWVSLFKRVKTKNGSKLYLDIVNIKKHIDAGWKFVGESGHRGVMSIYDPQIGELVKFMKEQWGIKDMVVLSTLVFMEIERDKYDLNKEANL